MPGQVGMIEVLVVLVIALLVLGPQRLPVVARNAGKAIREFKQAVSMPSFADDDEDDDTADRRRRELERERELDERERALEARERAAEERV